MKLKQPWFQLGFIALCSIALWMLGSCKLRAQQQSLLNMNVIPAQAAGGGTCPADGSAQIAVTGATVAGSISGSAATFYVGQVWNDGGTPRTICKVGIQLTHAAGSIAGKTYTAYIFADTGGGNFNPASPLATSTGVPGNDGWNGAFVRFTFPTPFTTTASASYIIVWSTGAADGSALAEYNVQNTGQIAGHYDGFNSSGNCQLTCGGSASLGIEIYYQ